MKTIGNIQLKRGTKSQVIAGSFLKGEPAVTLDTNDLYIGDGTDKIKITDTFFYDNFSSFPITGQVSKLYVDKTTRVVYIWTGLVYLQCTIPYVAAAGNMCQIYDSVGGTLINSTSLVIIPFNTETIKDNIFTHNNVTNNSRLYVTVTGYYRISYTIAFQSTSNSVRNLQTRIRKNGDSANGLIIPSNSYTSSNNNVYKFSSCTASFVTQLTTGTYIEAVSNGIGSTGVTTIAGQSWILIEFLR